jgi:hypothetical protein
MQRNPRSLLAIAALGGVLAVAGAGTAVASSAAAPRHGMVHIWVTPGKGAVDQILLTGVVADHGTATTTNANGAADANGTRVKVALSHGTFEVDTTAFHRNLNKLQPTVNKADCSVWGTGAGNVTVGEGTGAYAGISGTIRMSTSFAAIFPRFRSGAKKGQCDLNGAPTASFEESLVGSGQITL